jgi:hypothetical protein
MAFSSLTNLVRMTTATTGTGTMTLGSAVTGFLSVPAGLNGLSVTYEIADPGTAPTAREVGRGVYTSSGTTLTRATIFASTNGGSALSLSGAAYVSLSLADDDIKNLNPVSIQMQTSGSVNLAAGTATTDPLTFVSGTNLTSAANGAMEYDGNTLLFTPSSTSRGAVPATQFVALTSTNTLTSTTVAQKIFNVPSNGSLSVTGSTRYYFDMLLYITSMSASSGNAKIDILGGGNATMSSTMWTAYGIDIAAPTTATAPVATLVTAVGSAASIFTASTATALYVVAKGTFRVNAGGTLIPSISLVTAAAAVVNVDSYFVCWPMSASSATSLGNWT